MIQPIGGRVNLKQNLSASKQVQQPSRFQASAPIGVAVMPTFQGTPPDSPNTLSSSASHLEQVEQFFETLANSPNPDVRSLFLEMGKVYGESKLVMDILSPGSKTVVSAATTGLWIGFRRRLNNLSTELPNDALSQMQTIYSADSSLHGLDLTPVWLKATEALITREQDPVIKQKAIAAQKQLQNPQLSFQDRMMLELAKEL